MLWNRYKDSVSSIYQGISKVTLISIYIPNEFFTEEIYTWATSILDSRAIWWNGARHLVPMLDFVNCLEKLNGTDVIRVHATQYDKVPTGVVGDADNKGPKHALTQAGKAHNGYEL